MNCWADNALYPLRVKNESLLFESGAPVHNNVGLIILNHKVVSRSHINVLDEVSVLLLIKVSPIRQHVFLKVLLRIHLKERRVRNTQGFHYGNQFRIDKFLRSALHGEDNLF